MTPGVPARRASSRKSTCSILRLRRLNKFDRKGGEDALRDVRKQVQRNRKLFGRSAEEMRYTAPSRPRFNDDGVTALTRASWSRSRSTV